MDQKNYDAALECFSEGLQLSKEQGNKDLESIHTSNIASIYMLTGETAKAETLFGEASRMAREIGAVETVAEIEKQLSDLFTKRGDFGKALNHYKKHVGIRDSIFNRDNTEKNVRQEMNYKFEKKLALDKARHEEQVKLLEAQNATHRQMRIFLIVIIFLVLVMLAAMKRGYDNKKRLAEFLAADSDHKELLLQEVHHRINNNFQIISSLLTLQANSAESEQLKALLEKSQGRIQSLSALHELLYQKESLLEVNMAEYLEKVIDFHRDVVNPRIKIEMNVEPVVFSTKLAVPIALIVNELVTNSMKHAFAENQDGKILVSLKEPDERGKWTLAISDNGSGIKPSLETKRKSMGLRLVDMMKRQLNAEMTVNGNAGTTYTFTFKQAATETTKEKLLQATS
jgi:two-component sensor histidine kinase